MGMLVIRFQVMGDLVLSRALSRFGDSVRDFTPVWQEIREDFAVIEEQQFESEGSRGGTPWQPLSPTYAAWKERNFPGRPILQLTMKMWSELAVGTGLVVEMKPMSLLMEPSVPYAVFHQKGSPKTNLPARPLVVLTEEDKRRWVRKIYNFVYDKAKEARLR